ncbi:MAG: hypothetical protein P4N24_22105 [Acidobacteriota bacterium]|nr:hypothetical protein [Acidobacteriota bacterium]
MSMPGFTAEATLEIMKESYLLTPKGSQETGSVQPQGLFVNPSGDLVYCDNYVGCFVVHHKINHTLY